VRRSSDIETTATPGNSQLLKMIRRLQTFSFHIFLLFLKRRCAQGRSNYAYNMASTHSSSDSIPVRTLSQGKTLSIGRRITAARPMFLSLDPH
jgi:hypothetical protein